MNVALEEFAHLRKDLSSIEMVSGLTIWDFFAICRDRHPHLYEKLDPARVSVEHTRRIFAGMVEQATHFESKLEKGRGDSYRQAQNNSYLIRSVGFLRIFDLAVPERGRGISNLDVLDALGGNGTLTRIVRDSRRAEQVPFIVTNDVSARMIESALAQNLPAIRLPLQDLMWVKDCAFDAVIVAYGTHHIPPDERALALAEAYRVLRPGGRIVIQDFEIGCATTQWYEEVLDKYTLTGHRYKYFSREQFHDLLVGNSFSEVEVFNVYDPFILTADHPKEAKRRLLQYILTLFALDKLIPNAASADERDWDELEAIVRATSTFDSAQLPEESQCVNEFTVSAEGNRYRAEIPRVCLVATGRRPATASGSESTRGSL